MVELREFDCPAGKEIARTSFSNRKKLWFIRSISYISVKILRNKKPRRVKQVNSPCGTNFLSFEALFVNSKPCLSGKIIVAKLSSRTVTYFGTETREAKKQVGDISILSPEILRATSSVYFLPKVVSYATLLQNVSLLLPLLSNGAETTSRMFVLPPRFHADCPSSSSSLTAVQMRIFESAKKITQWTGSAFYRARNLETGRGISTNNLFVDRRLLWAGH